MDHGAGAGQRRSPVASGESRATVRRVTELAESGLWAAALGIVVLNLPFGFWRAGVRKFTLPWFVAVHAPVPFVVLLRIMGGVGWHVVSLPILVGAFFTGQFLGGAIRDSWRQRR